VANSTTAPKTMRPIRTARMTQSCRSKRLGGAFKRTELGALDGAGVTVADERAGWTLGVSRGGSVLAGMRTGGRGVGGPLLAPPELGGAVARPDGGMARGVFAEADPGPEAGELPPARPGNQDGSGAGTGADAQGARAAITSAGV
jgi:hypothetical protein